MAGETFPLVRFGQDNELVCPRCGGENLHHVAVTAYDRHEDDVRETVTTFRNELVASHREPAIATNNPSTRRHGLTISFTCEECSGDTEVIELALAQHKGSTYLRWRSIGSRQGVP